MTEIIKPKRALISVSNKTGLIRLAQTLVKHGVELISTGGSAKVLREAKLEVQDVGDYTGFPEILDGRVKTLHPKLHGGLLARRDEPTHMAALQAHQIKSIDLVIVNLYPFEETVRTTRDHDLCIENIDIGGVSLIRSGAKNYENVTVLVDPNDYDAVATAVDHGGISIGLRRELARKAFARVAAYDAAIASWFSQTTGEVFPTYLALGAARREVLRYGENPHQTAAVYVSDSTQHGVVSAQQLQGKALSYNNFNDTDTAYRLVAEFAEPAAAIIKHATPCGVATQASLAAAFSAALASDQPSAFGGIFAFNRSVDAATAQLLLPYFAEVVIAPSVSDEAQELFKQKPNLRVLVTGSLPHHAANDLEVKALLGGYLVQTADNATIRLTDVRGVTKRQPTPAEMADMLFGFRVVKHVKSNAIVLAKDNATIGIGAGQMSRVDAVRIAIGKSMTDDKNQPINFLEGSKATHLRARGAVLASDAFFPFPDGVLAAAAAGVTAIIQPGGSIRDNEVIATADAHGLAMVFTGVRHFRH